MVWKSDKFSQLKSHQPLLTINSLLMTISWYTVHGKLNNIFAHENSVIYYNNNIYQYHLLVNMVECSSQNFSPIKSTCRTSIFGFIFVPWSNELLKDTDPRWGSLVLGYVEFIGFDSTAFSCNKKYKYNLLTSGCQPKNCVFTLFISVLDRTSTS